MSGSVNAGVAVIVLRSLDNPQVLVSQRLSASGNSGIGKTAYAGGHVEREDINLHAAALREVREETGLSVSVVRPPYRGHISWFALKDDPNYFCSYLIAVVNGDSPDTIPSQEPDRTTDWFWVNINDLNTLAEDTDSWDWLQPISTQESVALALEQLAVEAYHNSLPDDVFPFVIFN